MRYDKKHQQVTCLILAFLTGLAFCVVNDNYVIPAELGQQLGNKIAILLWQINSAMKQPGYVLCMATVLLYFAYSHLWERLDKKLLKWSFPFSAVAAFILLLCESYYKYNSWDKVFGGQMAFLLSVVRGAGIAVLIFFFFHVICSWKMEVEEHGSTTAARWKDLLLPAVILLLCWLPYMIIMFPGNFCPDAVDEIAQITGNRDYCWTIKTIVTESEEILWNNHHPVFYTWILSVFIKLGQLLGSYIWGFAIYTMLQCISMAAVFSYFLYIIKKWGVSGKIRKWILIFFALNPIFPLWGVTITKDVYFALVLLLCVLQLYRFFREPETFAIKSRILLAVWLLLLMLLRNNGFYMLLVILPFAVWFLWKKKKQLVRVLVTLAVPMLIFQVGIQGILFSALNIPGGSIREMLSVPFQQTARYIRDYGEDMEEDEITAIETILGRYGQPYTKIGKHYVPAHADRIKNKFLPEADTEDLTAYLKAWFKGLTKHPDAYVEAFLNLNYSWFSFDSKQDFHYYYDVTRKDTKASLQKMEGKIEDMLGETARIPGFDAACQGVTYFVNGLSKIPFLSGVIEFSSYTWLYLICGLLMLMRRKYRELLSCGILFANYLICFVGPVAYTRYAVPMMVCVPFVVVLTFMAQKKTELEQDVLEENVLEEKS